MEPSWPVWPIFIIQFLSLGLFLLPNKVRILGFSTRAIIVILLLIIMIAIIASLYYDSTEALLLHF
jgi:hypothetical protein